jgi:hypothetical protein
LETVRKLPHVLGPRQSGIPEAEAERLAEILQLHHLMESQGSASGMRVSRGLYGLPAIEHFLAAADLPLDLDPWKHRLPTSRTVQVDQHGPSGQLLPQRQGSGCAGRSTAHGRRLGFWTRSSSGRARFGPAFADHGLGRHVLADQIGTKLLPRLTPKLILSQHYYQELYPQGAKPAAVGGREVSVIDQALKAGRPAMHRRSRHLAHDRAIPGTGLVHAAVDWMATVMNDHPNLEHLAKILRLKSCLELDEASLTVRADLYIDRTYASTGIRSRPVRSGKSEQEACRARCPQIAAGHSGCRSCRSWLAVTVL